QDPGTVDGADAVVLPGDGAFHDAMANLERLGLLPALGRALDGSRPFLGICLGYQLLFSTSEEFGEGRGLDVIPGTVRRFPPGRKVPHMGWNRVRHAGELRLFEGIPAGAYFYFVHSYYPVVAGTSSQGSTVGGLPEDRGAPVPRMSPGTVHVAWCEYGIEFAAAVARVPVEAGGGLRDARAVEAVLGAGASWAVVGTRALDPEFLTEVCDRFPQRIIIAADSRDGRVAVKGWVDLSELAPVEFALALRDQRDVAAHLAALLYTDVGRDGTAQGPN